MPAHSDAANIERTRVYPSQETTSYPTPGPESGAEYCCSYI